MKKAYVLSPISLGPERVEVGKIVSLEDREFAHLFRHGAVEPEEVYLAKKNAADIAAKARADAERLYDEVIERESTKADEIARAQSVERPDAFDPKRASDERRDASKRARAASAS